MSSVYSPRAVIADVYLLVSVTVVIVIVTTSHHVIISPNHLKNSKKNLNIMRGKVVNLTYIFDLFKTDISAQFFNIFHNTWAEQLVNKR